MRLSVCVMADIDEIDFYPHVESLGYDSAWVTDSHLWKRDVLLEGTAGLGHGDRLFPPGARPVVATPEGIATLCAVGSWGGQRPGLAGYVTGTGPKHGDGTQARGARRRRAFMLPILFRDRLREIVAGDVPRQSQTVMSASRTKWRRADSRGPR